MVIFSWKHHCKPNEAPAPSIGKTGRGLPLFIYLMKKRNIVPALVAGPPEWKTDAVKNHKGLRKTGMGKW